MIREFLRSSCDSVRFFREHAGYSFDPRKETPDEGRARCAMELALAELDARNYGLRFYWFVDREEPGHWVCVASLDGQAVESCGGVDVPEGHAYRRVVEAELAQAFCAQASKPMPFGGWRP